MTLATLEYIRLYKHSTPYSLVPQICIPNIPISSTQLKAFTVFRLLGILTESGLRWLFYRSVNAN